MGSSSSRNVDPMAVKDMVEGLDHNCDEHSDDIFKEAQSARMEDGPDIQAYLLQKTGQRTVPNVFVNQKHVGGCDDVAAANARGSLKALLAENAN